MKLIILLLLVSCSSSQNSLTDGKTDYNYSDVSGKFRLSREKKTLDKKIITRTQLLMSAGGNAKILEKSITLSHLGSIKGPKGRLLTLRPEASEFSVWLEGKAYSSKMSLDTKNKSLKIVLKSPEAKWNGTTLVSFPKGRYFCFYSQIPECLYHLQFLQRILKNQKENLDFYVIWDSYPYVQDQLSGVGKNVFSTASVRFDGKFKKLLKYEVEIDGQVLLYHFSSSFELVKMAWVSQGITILPYGEEVSDNELE